MVDTGCIKGLACKDVATLTKLFTLLKYLRCG